MNRTPSPAPVGRWGRRLISPWLQPLPWLSLVLLLLCTRTEPPRLWFWLTLLLISLAVGLLQGLARRR
ncbi:MAG: hypothetical protein VKM01_06895 [Cyanobacteriota bacterium]|jgi:hypothetical protein|nr:hypothetical protein [Cyanobacteriota bacterium]